MTPPSNDYKAPPSYDQKFQPPTQGYLPPSTAAGGAKIQPPKSDYLPPPPGSYSADMMPPSHCEPVVATVLTLRLNRGSEDAGTARGA